MKIKYLALAAALALSSFTFPGLSSGQGMMAPSQSEASGTTVQKNDGHAAQEEAEGKALWQKIQAKEIACQSLTADNFAALGEYFMGQMAGASHEAMNNMMTQMMGAQGEEQMHIAIGKRMSGCEPNAPLPQGMMGGYSSGMMGAWGQWAAAGWITLVLLWVMMASVSVYLIKRVNKK